MIFSVEGYHIFGQKGRGCSGTLILTFVTLCLQCFALNSIMNPVFIPAKTIPTTHRGCDNQDIS
jgi:hypothetical protein